MSWVWKAGGGFNNYCCVQTLTWLLLPNSANNLLVFDSTLYLDCPICFPWKTKNLGYHRSRQNNLDKRKNNAWDLHATVDSFRVSFIKQYEHRANFIYLPEVAFLAIIVNLPSSFRQPSLNAPVDSCFPRDAQTLFMRKSVAYLGLSSSWRVFGQRAVCFKLKRHSQRMCVVLLVVWRWANVAFLQKTKTKKD